MNNTYVFYWGRSCTPNQPDTFQRCFGSLNRLWFDRTYIINCERTGTQSSCLQKNILTSKMWNSLKLQQIIAKFLVNCFHESWWALFQFPVHREREGVTPTLCHFTLTCRILPLVMVSISSSEFQPPPPYLAKKA